MQKYNTYINEDEVVDLINYYDNHFGEQFTNMWLNSEKAILTIMQDYLDTTGDVAGGYVKAAPNLYAFIETYFSKVEKCWMQQVELGLYRGSLFPFILNTYIQFNWKVMNDKPIAGAKYWSDEKNDYIII